MKKLHVFLAFALMSTMLFAQSRNLRTADNELRRNRLERAVPAIKLAMNETENQTNANAWLSKARIFAAVAASQNPAHRDLAPDAIEVAFQAYQKAFEFDRTGIVRGLSSIYIGQLMDLAHDRGATLYAESRFQEAADAFMISVKAAALIDIVDTNAIFNAAFCATAAGNRAMAHELNQQLVDMRADQPMAFTALAISFKEQGDFANAAKYADLAVELFPDNYNAMINAASIHLMIENSERASQILMVMAEQYYDNAVVFFAKGVALDQINMPEEAERAYLRAIELRPDYFDAIFNLAAHYVTRGVAIRAEADGLPTTAEGLRKYDEMIEQSNVLFKKAIPLLEKTLEMEPSRDVLIAIMSTLRDIYVQLRMLDKGSELHEQIEALRSQ